LVSQDLLEISLFNLQCHCMKFANYVSHHNFYSNNLSFIDYLFGLTIG
jgi:hypothetical protein